jgi:transposase
MLIDLTHYRFFLRPGVTDLRKAVNGLTLLAQNEMNHDPFSKSLFLFCNRRRKLLKIVYWDKNGFCLWQKRLAKQKFPWPETTEEAQEIGYEQVKMLLAGIDFFRAHEELRFSRV